jgi:hypothetical protein
MKNTISIMLLTSKKNALNGFKKSKNGSGFNTGGMS